MTEIERIKKSIEIINNTLDEVIDDEERKSLLEELEYYKNLLK